jgi:hypothetical protein
MGAQPKEDGPVSRRGVAKHSPAACGAGIRSRSGASSIPVGKVTLEFSIFVSRVKKRSELGLLVFRRREGPEFMSEMRRGNLE